MDEDIYQAEGGNPDFSHLIGIMNYSGEKLAKAMFDEWEKDPRKELYCVFCGTKYPMGVTFCRPCKEYKGISPYIAGWSD